MTTKIKPAESHIKLAEPKLPANVRSGGEMIPLDYPSLYQIQAGDWRISYAVEHNRLAILVLEVLNPDGESSKDAVQTNLTRKMKIKLLDWPEGAGDAQVPAEDLTRKMKIKWLDMAKDGEVIPPDGAQSKSRIKLKGGSNGKGGSDGKSAKPHKITLLDAVAEPADSAEASDSAPEVDVAEETERKVTPLDEPTMK